MVLDISGSMEALDFQSQGRDVSRLTAVKQVVRDFVLGSRERDCPGVPMTWWAWWRSEASPTANAR